jgi:hypothetical protein
MAENLTPIKLDEMSLGLFRIHWTSFMEIQKNFNFVLARQDVSSKSLTMFSP